MRFCRDLCGAKICRRLPRLVADAADDFGDRAVDDGAGIWVFGGKAIARGARRLLGQEEEVRTRDIGAHADDDRQVVVAG